VEGWGLDGAKPNSYCLQIHRNGRVFTWQGSKVSNEGENEAHYHKRIKEWQIAFGWHLAEIALLGLLVFFCNLFKILWREQVFHIAFSLTSFGLVRCLESANRMEERVTECHKMRECASILKSKSMENLYSERYAFYSLLRNGYFLFTGVTLICWVIVATTYVFALKELHEGHTLPSWLTFLSFLGTGLAVVTAIVKTWKSAQPDPKLCVVSFAKHIKFHSDEIKKNRGDLA